MQLQKEVSKLQTNILLKQMKKSRRDFLSKTGVATIIGTSILHKNATALLDTPQGNSPQGNTNQTSGKTTKHELPALPYAYNALEPFIDETTMKLHHDKHHQAYVDGLNKAEGELAKARVNNDFSMIQHWSKQSAFHGGGHFLHSLFWRIMAASNNGGGGKPNGVLLDKIIEDFGSFEIFQKQFNSAATTVEGGGWAILHYRKQDNRLIILQAENQHKFSQWGTTPILAIDVWEHAYYLKYQNKRTDYVNSWWNVVNWNEVSKNFIELTK